MQVNNGISVNAQMVASHVTHGQQIPSRERQSDIHERSLLERITQPRDSFEHGTLIETVGRHSRRRDTSDYRAGDEDSAWARRFNERQQLNPEDFLPPPQRPDPWRALSVDRTRETQERAANNPAVGERPPNLDQLMNRAKATLQTFEPVSEGTFINTLS